MSLAKILLRALFITIALCAGETALRASLVSFRAALVCLSASLVSLSVALISAAASWVAGLDASAVAGAAASRVLRVWAASNSFGFGSSFFFSFFTLGMTMTSRSMAMWTGFLEIFT